MNAIPPLAREAWTTHPNYPRQTLLLRSHDRFRHLSRLLLRRAGAPLRIPPVARWRGSAVDAPPPQSLAQASSLLGNAPTTEPRSAGSVRYSDRRSSSGADAGAIEYLFRQWKWMMGGHEHYEESKLYPYLEARWGVSTTEVAAGHGALRDADAEVRRAFEELEGPGPATPELCSALMRHDAVLHAHLELEEALVIPALLALEHAEYDALVSHELPELLEQLGRPPRRDATSPARAE